MSLYDTTQEIKQIEWAMLEWAEAHDGDVTDFPLVIELDSLTSSKDEKILSIALWYKNIISDAQAIEREVEALDKRANTLFKKADSIEGYIALCLGKGNKLNDPKVDISWKKSKAVKLLCEVDKLPLQFKRTKTTVEPDKVELKKAIESGTALEYAVMEEKETIKIK